MKKETKKRKAKKKPELWLSRDGDDGTENNYELWVIKPVWKPRREIFAGSKGKGLLDDFCPDDFEKACPHLKLKGGEKCQIEIRRKCL